MVLKLRHGHTESGWRSNLRTMIGFHAGLTQVTVLVLGKGGGGGGGGWGGEKVVLAASDRTPNFYKEKKGTEDVQAPNIKLYG